MADMTAVFTIVGEDLLSGPANAATGALEKLESQSTATSQAMAVLGTAMMAAGTAIGVAAVAGVKAAGDLEQAVANISSIKPEIDTSAVFASLNEMSTRVPQSSKQLADSLYDIFSSMDVSTEGAMSLLETFARGAVGAQTDAQTFGTAIMGVMNAYHLSVEDATNVSDIFFNTVNRGVVTGPQLASGLGAITASAKLFGTSFAEVGALIVGVTQEGGDAAQNLNNLNNLLIKIATPQAAAGFKDLGIAVANADGSMRTVTDILSDLNDKTSTMTESAKLLAIQKIFPDMQARAGAVVIMDQLDRVKAALAENESATGSAAAAFEKMNATFNSQLKILQNTFTSILVTLGARLLPLITPLITAFSKALPDAFKAADQAVSNFAKSVTPVLDGVVRSVGAFLGLELADYGDTWDVLGGVVSRATDLISTGIDSVVGAFGALPEPVKAAALAFTAVMLAADPLVTVIGAATVAFGLLAAPIGALLSPLGLLAAAVGALAYAWESNLGDMQGQFSAFVLAVEPMIAGLQGVIMTAFDQGIGPAFESFLLLMQQIGTRLAPILADWGAQFSAWVPGAISALVTTLTTAVAAIPWATIWAAATTAATSLATYLGSLVVDFATWLTAQVALIPWPTIWATMTTVATTLGTFLLTQVIDFATWLTAQVALIKWADIWATVTTVATTLGTFLLTQVVDFATWLGQQAAAIPWADVWSKTTTVATELATYVATLTVDFATWLGNEVAAIKWADVWQRVVGLLEAMATAFTTAARGIDWGAVITANAQMAQQMSDALTTQIIAAFDSLKWTVVGEGVGRGLVIAIAVAFGLTEVSDAWADGFGSAIGRALPKAHQALVQFLAGVFMGALEEAWNLSIASWVPGVGTITAPTPGSGGWQYTPPGGSPAPVLPPNPNAGTGAPVFPSPAYPPAENPPAGTGTYVPPEQIPTTGPELGPALPSAPPAGAPAGSKTYGPIDNSSRASFARTAWPIFLDAAGGDANLAQMMIAAAISENGSVGGGGPIGVGNNFYGIKAPGPSSATGSFTAGTWEAGVGATSGTFASFPDPVTGANAFMQFLQENPRYAPALANYQKSGDAEALFRDINAAGYATDPEWGRKIANIRANQVAPNVPTSAETSQPVQITAPAQPGPTAAMNVANINTSLNQFQASTLTADEAMAACGPAAATWFAQAVGRNPTLGEATALAKTFGWTAASGMPVAGEAGLINALVSGTGYQTASEAPTAANVNAALASGSPVGINVLPGGRVPGGHFFVATGGTAEGGLDVGATGTALKYGQPTYTLAELQAMGGGLANIIKLTPVATAAIDATSTSVQNMGEKAQTSTPQLAAIGTSIDPVVASMDTGAVSVSQMTDAIIASAAQQGVATESAAAYSQGLTDQQTALEGVLAGFAATTPAAADLLTQLDAGAISTDQASVAFAGLSTSTAIATGSLQSMATDGAGAVSVMGGEVLTDADTMSTGLTTATDTMNAQGTLDLQTLQANGSLAVETLNTSASLSADTMQTNVTLAADTMQTDASLAAATMQTDVALSAETMNTDASLSASTMQANVSLSADTMQTDASTSASTMQTDVSGAADTMNTDASGSAGDMQSSVSGSLDTMQTDASGSADTMNTDVSGSVSDMATSVSGSLGELTQPLSDTSSGMGDVGSAADGATGPVGDFASAVADAGTKADTSSGPVGDFADTVSNIDPPDLSDWVNQIDDVKNAADDAAQSLQDMADAGDGGGDGGDHHRARGGPVYHDRSYIVGERGPELFVPRGSGVIIPNHRLRGLADGGTIDLGGANMAPNISTDPVPVSLDDPSLSALTTLVGLTDAVRAGVVDVQAGIQTLADTLGGAILTGLTTISDALGVLTQHVDTHATDLVNAIGTDITYVTAKLSDVVAAIGELGKVAATGVTLLQGLVTAMTRSVSAPGARTTPTTPPAAAAPAAPAAPPSPPPGWRRREVSPGIFIIEPDPNAPPARMSPMPTDIGTGRPPGGFVAEPGITPVPSDIGTGAPPSPGVTEPGHTPSPSDIGIGIIHPGEQPVAEPRPSGPTSPVPPPVPPGASHGQEPVGTGPIAAPGAPAVTAPSGHGGDVVGSTLSAAAASTKALTASVAANTTAMQNVATQQAKNMADHVGGSSEQMRNDVSQDVYAMARTSAGDIGTMSSDAVGYADTMQKGVSGDAVTMKGDVISAADLMKAGATGASNLMSSGVQGDMSEMYTKSAGPNGWMDKLRGDSIDLASKMNTGVTGSASALNQNLNDAPNGALYDTARRGLDHIDTLRNDSINLIGGNPKGVQSLVKGVQGAIDTLNQNLNDAPNGALYDTVRRGLAHIDTLRDKGISLATRAAVGDDGKSGIVGAFGKMADSANKSGDAMDGDKDSTLASLKNLGAAKPNFSAIVNEIGRIETAAKSATTAINKIPTSPGQTGTRSDVVVSGDLIDYDRLAAAIVGANAEQDAVHPLNLSLTLTAETQDLTILDAQNGGGAP